METYERTDLKVDVLIQLDLLRILLFDLLTYYIDYIENLLYIYYSILFFEDFQRHNQTLFFSSNALKKSIYPHLTL